MTELETLLLKQLEQQQHDSARLVSGLSEQLDRLQTALNEQHAESRALRRELERSDQQNAGLIERLSGRVDMLTTLLNDLRTQLSR